MKPTIPTMVSSVRPAPKPKAFRKKVNPYCNCKKFWRNREDYKTCKRCNKPIQQHKMRKVLEETLDDIVKQIVLKRDGFCVCPPPERGHSSVRQPGHLITRGRRGVKWDLWNVNEQCSNCNYRHSLPNQWMYYGEWFATRFGAEELSRLRTESDESAELSIDELEELLRQLTEIHHRQQEDKFFLPRFSQKQILSGEWKQIDASRKLQETMEAEMTK